MVSWSGDGTLSAYNGTERKYLASQYFFASLGTVDTSAITRLGFGLDAEHANVLSNRIYATAPFTLTSGDISDNSIGVGDRRFGVNMYVAPDTSFGEGVVPTPSQVRSAALANGTVTRSTLSYVTAGTRTFYIKGPRPQQGLKYWVLVYPVVQFTNSAPATDRSLFDYPVDTIGRVLSIYSNRTPLAPTITSPTTGQTVAPGGSFTLTVEVNDPDEIAPPDADRYNLDLAGIEFQYAAQATVENPTPEWMPLEFYVSDGSASAYSWSIVGSNFTTASSDDGNEFLRLDLGGEVLCAVDLADAEPQKAILPGGNWQIRCRTFDFGHPYPTEVRPLGWQSSGLGPRPSDFPTTNTSPWSEAIRVSVPAQVPPPIPTFPIDNVAISINDDVFLSWQYRNIFVPPFAQSTRLVEIRKVGDAGWTTVVDESSSSNSVEVTGFTFEEHTQYEWRVQVSDTDGEVSNFSSVARFWIVPVAASGPVRPGPSENIDGATLGCGTHRVEVYRRGGLERVGEIRNVSYVDWSRVRDDFSTAQVRITDWDIDNGNLLASLQCWAYEIVIWRDNGFTTDRVWEGPITLLTYEADKVTIDAKDCVGYLYRRIIKQKMTDRGISVVDRARRVIQNALAPDDPNVLQYLTILTRDDDAVQYRSTPAYARTAYEEIDDMAANAGLDYTCVGRNIMIWGTKHRIGTLPEFRDADLGASPIVSEYGMNFANRYVVSDGNGVWGEATRLDVSGNDETYGLVEMLSSTWASDSGETTGTYTQEDVQRVSQTFAEFAERSISDRYPSPVVVRVPDNTTLNPSTVISIQQLVPGVVIPLRSTATLREVVGSQKLDSVKVVEESGKETVSVTMSAFSRDDATGEESNGGDEAEEPEMGSRTLRPEEVVADEGSDNLPSVVVGGDTALADDDDATYARVGLATGAFSVAAGYLHARFPAVPDLVSLTSLSVSYRGEYTLGGNATEGRFYAYLTSDLAGLGGPGVDIGGLRFNWTNANNVPVIGSVFDDTADGLEPNFGEDESDLLALAQTALVNGDFCVHMYPASDDGGVSSPYSYQMDVFEMEITIEGEFS